MHQIVACLFHCIERLIENKTRRRVRYSTGTRSKRIIKSKREKKIGDIRIKKIKRKREYIEISGDKIFENRRFNCRRARSHIINIRDKIE